MKKLLFTLIAAVLILGGCNKSEQFKVNLNLDNADQQTVYLYKVVDGTGVCIDSAVFKGNNAVLTADFDEPQTTYRIQFDKTPNCDQFPFFTENQNTTISGDRENMMHWTVKGCPIMDEWTAYRESLMPLEDEIMAIFEETNDLYMAGDTVQAAEVYSQFEAKMADYTNYCLDYIRNHSDSFLSHVLLDQSKEEFEIEDVKEVYEKFTFESVYSKSVKDYIEMNERVQIGQNYIDFVLQTADGKDVSLAEIVKGNKLTLVDFWASWCGPCRRENPVVKAAYEKYHAKGLEIIGVDVDRDEEAWLKAVAEDGLPWIHVRDIDSEVSTNYLVQYIPSNFLFDQNGVMIAKNLRGNDLEAKLAEVLK